MEKDGLPGASGSGTTTLTVSMYAVRKKVLSLWKGRKKCTSLLRDAMVSILKQQFKNYCFDSFEALKSDPLPSFSFH